MTPYSRDDLATALPGATERGEVIAYFQPQLDLATSRVVSAEALARWEHPDFGLINPAAFIPLAEESGLISDIGRFMFIEACRNVASWRSAGLDIEVAVNVSILELRQEGYSEGLLALVEECGADPAWMTLEVTETRAADDLEVLNRRLSTAKESGIAISIDDFGIGHSTIDRVRRLEADELKIDRSYIQGSESALDSVRDLLEDARAAGVRLVAEGIETEQHLQRAKDLGCERGQGYLFSRPVVASQLVQLFG